MGDRDVRAVDVQVAQVDTIPALEIDDVVAGVDAGCAVGKQVVVEGVTAISALKEVLPEATLRMSPAIPTVEVIGTGPAVENVAAVTAEQEVGTETAVEDVIAVLPKHNVRPSARIDRVVAVAAEDHVRPSARIDMISAVASRDHIDHRGR